MPIVKVPPVLRPKTGGEAEVSADGATVGEVLTAFADAHPDTREQLFDTEGELNRYVNVYLNDEDVRVLDGLDTPAAGGDTVVILPAMAGGESPDEAEAGRPDDAGGEPEPEQTPSTPGPDAGEGVPTEEDISGDLPGVPEEASEDLPAEDPSAD
jgi:sulfur-carrier protein